MKITSKKVNKKTLNEKIHKLLDEYEEKRRKLQELLCDSAGIEYDIGHNSTIARELACRPFERAMILEMANILNEINGIRATVLEFERKSAYVLDLFVLNENE